MYTHTKHELYLFYKSSVVHTPVSRLLRRRGVRGARRHAGLAPVPAVRVFRTEILLGTEILEVMVAP